ncbi:MAG: hypothetical protein QOI59_1066 [Gammaproteobacteria bacterium]|nr:hypothetical protein [Gammaproteobacteria bacterium]
MTTKFPSAGLCMTLGIVLSVGRADEVPSAIDCQTHFTTEGNFLTGRKYSTWVLLPGTAKAVAYTRVYSSIAKDGWSIVNADKDAGIISAAQGVSYGRGSQAPMTIVVEDDEKGSRVSVTFRTGGAQTAREETVRTKLCSYLVSSMSP